MRALVVGFGRMGSFHAKTLRDLGYHVTTVDPNPDQRADHLALEDATALFPSGTSSPARSYDVAAVAVPARDLLDTAYQLAGVPKLLVEKPFATCIREARLLAAYLEASRSDVCVGLVERFNPQVRALRALLRDRTLRDVTHVKFTRWNDRPSFDEALDLRLHDVDLARFLGHCPEVEFDTRAGCSRKVRKIEVTHAEGTVTFDLMDHSLSPLHGLWHAFLTDGDYPKPKDVIQALEVLPLTYARQPVAA